jgi:hypothetical protein
MENRQAAIPRENAQSSRAQARRPLSTSLSGNVTEVVQVIAAMLRHL